MKTKRRENKPLTPLTPCLLSVFFIVMLPCQAQSTVKTKKHRPKYHTYDKQVNWSESTPVHALPSSETENDRNLFGELDLPRNTIRGSLFENQSYPQNVSVPNQRRRQIRRDTEEDNWLNPDKKESRNDERKAGETDWGWLAAEVRVRQKEQKIASQFNEEQTSLMEEKFARKTTGEEDRLTTGIKQTDLGFHSDDSGKATGSTPLWSGARSVNRDSLEVSDANEESLLSDWEKDLGLNRSESSPSYINQGIDSSLSRQERSGIQYHANTSRNDDRASDNNRGMRTLSNPDSTENSSSLYKAPSFRKTENLSTSYSSSSRPSGLQAGSMFSTKSSFANESSTFSSDYTTPSYKSVNTPSASFAGWNTGLDQGSSFSSGSRLETFRQLHKSANETEPLGGSSSSWIR